MCMWKWFLYLLNTTLNVYMIMVAILCLGININILLVTENSYLQDVANIFTVLYSPCLNTLAQKCVFKSLLIFYCSFICFKVILLRSCLGCFFVSKGNTDLLQCICVCSEVHWTQ